MPHEDTNAPAETPAKTDAELMAELDDLWGAPELVPIKQTKDGNCFRNVCTLNYELDWNPPWFIGPCIRPGDVAYFVGPDGSGKSTLIAELIAKAVTPTWALSGDAKFETPCLSGAWRINREHIGDDDRVLIVNAETDGKDAWNARLQATLISHGFSPASRAFSSARGRIDYMESDDLGLDAMEPHKRRAAAYAVANTIIEMNYRIVVLDPVFGVFGADDNADANWVTFGMRPLCKRLKEHGITTLIAAHPAKVSEIKGISLRQRFSPFGTSQQEGIMDVRLGVAPSSRDPQRICVYRVKSRRGGWVVSSGKTVLTLVKGNPASYTMAVNAEQWSVENPVVLPMPPDVLEIFAAVPSDRDHFYFEDVSSKYGPKGLDKRKWAMARDEYFMPYGLMLQERDGERPGRPLRYHLTGRGQTERSKLSA